MREESWVVCTSSRLPPSWVSMFAPNLKDWKQQPEEGVNGSLKFLSKYLAAVPTSIPNASKFSKHKYPSQLVTRVPWLVPQNGRKIAQQTEYDLEQKWINCVQNRKSGMEKLTEKPLKIRSTQNRERRGSTSAWASRACTARCSWWFGCLCSARFTHRGRESRITGLHAAAKPETNGNQRCDRNGCGYACQHWALSWPASWPDDGD
jgi:hypothetical protein